MPMSKFDLEYNEYLNRRDAAGYGKAPPTAEGKPPSKFVPKSSEPKPKTPKKVDPELLKGDGSYELPNNAYKPSGYREKPSELGEDPLSTVRTLKNNLRKRALTYQQRDLPVKAHLCEGAIDELSQAEGELLRLGQQRSNAILVGDNTTAQKINKDMERVKEKAVRNAYADLIMGNDEMHAFGVDSKWTPDREPRPPTPKWVRPKTPEDARFQPRSVPRVRERPVTEDRPRSVKRATTPQRAKTPQRVGTPKKVPPNDIYVKRNERLYPNGFPGQKGPDGQVWDDPYDLPDTSGICEFCDEGDRNLGTKRGREDHYAVSCMMMNRCRYCQKVLLVSDLTDHYLKRCSFLGESMVACPRCGLAMHKNDEKEGIEHPLCRSRKAPQGAQWCPLCSVAVDNNREAWRKHTVEQCYHHPRRLGFDEDPEIPEEESLPPRAGGPGGKVGSDGRMIDATKLVKALQDIQLAKKAAKKPKAEKTPKTDTTTPTASKAPTTAAPTTAATKK